LEAAYALLDADDPLGPVAPFGPVGPREPFVPFVPLAPAAPVGPVAPRAPVGPFGLRWFQLSGFSFLEQVTPLSVSITRRAPEGFAPVLYQARITPPASGIEA
jgi:hypothetical protein